MRALITGARGQDAYYLARILTQQGYTVYGTSRQDGDVDFFNKVYKVDPWDFKQLYRCLCDVQPYEIYNMAAFTNVAQAEAMDEQTLHDFNVQPLIHLMNVALNEAPAIKIFHAGSVMAYNFMDDILTESAMASWARPATKYGQSKLLAHMLANSGRREGLHITEGIFFHHTSPQSKEGFFSKVPMYVATLTKNPHINKLNVGNINIVRDVGFAKDYMRAAVHLLQNEKPDCYNIATGYSYTLETYIKACFDIVNLDHKDYINIDENLKRPYDILYMRADITKLKHTGWKPEKSVSDLAELMVTHYARF